MEYALLPKVQKLGHIPNYTNKYKNMQSIIYELPIESGFSV